MSETPDTELTAEEARAMVDQLTYDLYRSEDARAWVREQCDIRDHQQQATPGQGTVQTAEVLAWLQGPKCGRMLGAEVRSDTACDRQMTVLRDALGAVTGQCRALEAELVACRERYAVQAENALAAVTAAETEAAGARSTLDRVRDLCELTIAASVRVQAVQQARDTLDLIGEQPAADSNSAG